MNRTKIKSFLLNPWTLTVGGALLSFVLTLIGDYIKGKQLSSTFVSILKWVCDILITILNYELKVWWIITGIAVICLGLWIYIKILDTNNSNSQEPPFLEYTQDNLLGYRWEWTWEKNYDDKYAVENLEPICTDCGTPLCDDYQSYYGLTCLRCKKSHTGAVPKEDHVKTLIYDNVKKRYFNKKEDF